VTGVRQGKWPTPHKTLREGRPVCRQCRNPDHFPSEEGKGRMRRTRPQRRGGGHRRHHLHSLVLRIMYSLKAPRTDYLLMAGYRSHDAWPSTMEHLWLSQECQRGRLADITFCKWCQDGWSPSPKRGWYSWLWGWSSPWGCRRRKWPPDHRLSSGSQESAWRKATYTTRSSAGWRTSMLAVQETRSLPKWGQALAAWEEGSGLGGGHRRHHLHSLVSRLMYSVMGPRTD
jgi:hypothetical protein